MNTIFHLAIPITNVTEAKKYYVDGLGCELGRESRHAVVLNLYGHQVVAHTTTEPITPQKGIYPRHFGMIFPSLADWEAVLQRVKEKQLPIYEEPKHRFPGQLTEHRTFFLEDPFHNLMEFKYYARSEAIFGGRELAEIGDRGV